MNALTHAPLPSSVELGDDVPYPTLHERRFWLDTERRGRLAVGPDRQQTWSDRTSVQVDYSDLSDAQQTARQMCSAIADALCQARCDAQDPAEPHPILRWSEVAAVCGADQRSPEPGCYADLGTARRTAIEMRCAILSLRQLLREEASATGGVTAIS